MTLKTGQRSVWLKAWFGIKTNTVQMATVVTRSM